MSKLSYRALEEKVRELEKTLQGHNPDFFWDIYALSPVPTLIVDVEGALIRYNQAMAELTGYMHEELPDIETMLPKFFPDEKYRKKAWEECNNSLLVKHARTHEYSIICKTGGKHTVRCIMLNIPSMDEQKGFHIIQFIDITEHKKTEEMLEKAREELEKRVSERTSELEKSNKELQREIISRFFAEEKLRENNELLEKIFSNTHLMIAYMDRDFNFIRVNRAYAEADGRTPEFFNGKNHFTLYPNQENEAIFRRVIETGKIFTVYAKPFVYPEHPERGMTFWDWSLIPVIDISGKVEGVILGLVDVTARIRVQEKLDEREKVYRELMDFLPQTVVEFDMNGNLTFINRSGFEIFGYSIDDFKKGINIFDIISLEDRDKARKNLGDVIKGLRSGPGEYAIKKKDGTPVHIITYSNAIIRDNKPVGARGIIIDITDLKQTEQALREERSKMEVLLNNERLLATVAFSLNSSDSLHESMNDILKMISSELEIDNVCMWNPFSRSDDTLSFHYRIQGKSMRYAEDRPAFSPHFQKLLQEGQAIIVSNLDGLTAEEKKYFAERNILSVVNFPMKISGDLMASICFCQNHPYTWHQEKLDLLKTITEIIASTLKRHYHIHARIEAEKKQTEAIQIVERASRLASIGVIAGGITHEINQPLSAIKVTADSILFWHKHNEGILPETFITMLNKISESVDRISDIIRHMRSFWVATDQIEKTTTDMNKAVNKAASLVNRQLHAHGIKPVLSLFDRNLMVSGNPIHLEQIVINLVTNAMNALDSTSRKDKTITISTGQNDTEAVLEVIDNGTGLPEGIGEKIYDPFYSTSKPGEGTGLGLAIVKRFVDEHNGSIEACNNSDGGVTFTVRFPLSPDTVRPDNEHSAR
ncbi:PAS domain S-box protein [bacterium]|nr:PAS domain S-box protein [bacterium]